MIDEIEAFAAAMRGAMRAAQNTVVGYRRDLKDFHGYLMSGRTALDGAGDKIDSSKISADHIRNHLSQLIRAGAERTTVQRRLFAIKAFFRWRETTTGTPSPARAMRSIKTAKRLPQVMSEDAVANLIEADGAATPPATMRARAILELIYSTGLRVSELTGLSRRD